MFLRSSYFKLHLGCQKNCLSFQRLLSASPLALEYQDIAEENKAERINLHVNRERLEWIKLKSSSQVKSYYEFQDSVTEPIGIGAFGAVHRVKQKGLSATRTVGRENTFALKQMKKVQQPFYWREIEMFKRIKYRQNCLQVCQVLETPNTVFLVSELLNGGDLFDFVAEFNVGLGNLSVREALLLTKKMLEAIESCHLNNFAHLDIKPENFVFRENVKRTGVENAELVLIDFGSAQPFIKRPFAKKSTNYGKGKDEVWHCTTGSTKLTGTIGYVSPEMLMYNRFSSRSDLWSLGISLFMMITGERPFDDPCDKAIQRQIIEESRKPRAESVFVNSEAIQRVNVPQSVKTLIKSLTEILPEDRPSATEALLAVEKILAEEFKE